MTSTTPPITVSITFPVMIAAAALFGCPRLVIPGRPGATPAAQDRARRVIGVGRTGHVRLMRLFPGIARAVGPRQLVDRVMQPGMPLRRHLRRLRLAMVDHPALLAARPPAAAPHRPAALLAVIAVAKAVSPHQLAA